MWMCRRALSEALRRACSRWQADRSGCGAIHQRAVAAGLARPRVVELWRAANLRARGQLMTILNGGSAFSTANGTVMIDLSPIVGNLSSTLSEPPTAVSRCRQAPARSCCSRATS